MAFLIDRLFVRRNLIGSDIVIVTAIVLHLFEVYVFVTTRAADGAIPMAGLLSVFYANWIAAPVLFAAALAAAIGQWKSDVPPEFRFLLLMGQETLFIITALTAIVHILHQSYADCVVLAECVRRSWQFIACDQAHRLMAPFIYGVAIYARVRAS